MIKKLTKTKKGITILEAVISVAILSIIIVPLSMMVVTSVKTNKNGQDKQQAIAIAQRITEDLKIHNVSAAPASNVINLLDGSIFLNKITPDSGYNLGYKASDVNVGNGFTADISFQRAISFSGNSSGNVTDFDVTIEMKSNSSFVLTDSGGVPNQYNSLKNLYIREDKDYLKMYSYTKLDEIVGDSINTLIPIFTINKAGTKGKIKIVYLDTLSSNSEIKVSGSDNSDSKTILTVYCYKNNNNSFSNTVTNIGGYVNIYDNLKVIGPEAADTKGKYDAFIQIYKNINGIKIKVYDVKTSINLVD
jgi:Tfp pilus assembly protein PilV